METISSCPICNIQVLTVELEWHANSHFDDDQLQRDMELAHQMAIAESSTGTMNDPKRYSGSFTSDSNTLGASSSHSGYSRHYSELLDEQISCLIGAQIRSKVQEVEGGIMSLLRGCLESEAGSLTSMISGYIEHHQSLSSEDKGWGCGWRNIQMLSSHLLKQRPEARVVLFGGSGFVPDIPSLQRWLDIAWDKKFDTIGSSHFHNKVYGANKWIGTTECATLFRCLASARIVDFDSTESSDLQSHSRTIVGIQKKMGHCGSQEQYTLLILDPGHRTADLERSLRSKKGWQRLVKRGVHTLRKPQYQLCYVDPGIASLEEMEQLKDINNDSILVRF
ncbi:unnamed protein product [Miscanthus lutarioriparius]|uniref:UFSP1/2/DUB catalytic domain-containing protein n=1 Tax=Miscanthus lutarioriparius TaxID=422564 RepID=A0A811SFT2_9POAL|nr:unnamed protein product [Miscanthus lutarioriparius]